MTTGAGGPGTGSAPASTPGVVTDVGVDDDEAGTPLSPTSAPTDEASEASEAAGATGTVAAAADPEAPWERLSWRMLLVDPLGSLTRLAPLFLISLWLGSNRSNYWFEIIVISLVVLVGVLRWLSTSYQIGRTHIILRKGFFSRQVVTVARNRIRSVDTESDLFHRVMRVSIVEVGTGRADSGKSGAERHETRRAAA